MMMRLGDIPGRIFFMLSQKSIIGSSDLDGIYTDFIELLRKKSLEEIFIKIWPEARNNLPLCLHKQNL